MPDLSDPNLSNTDFSFANLSKADLAMSNVPNANLSNAIMIECRGYENMECEKADFNDAIINDTKLIENTPKKKRKSRLKDDN